MSDAAALSASEASPTEAVAMFGSSGTTIDPEEAEEIAEEVAEYWEEYSYEHAAAK